MVGFALFGSVTYLPLFLQVVNGASPTGSGLQILPMMGGLLLTSIGSGQLISRTGVYKPFPIIATAVMVVGLALLSEMNAQTSRLVASLYMLVLGLGLGMVVQVLVLAVQNAVDYKDLGVATSGATLFRSIGGSIGTAILGSIFSNRLGSELTKALPRGTSSRLAGDAGVDLSPAACWLIVRPARGSQADIAALCRTFDIAEQVGMRAFSELQERELVGAVAGARELTPAGEETVEKLVAERRGSLARLCDGWAPDENPELAGLLTRLARDLAREPSHEVHAHA